MPYFMFFDQHSPLLQRPRWGSGLLSSVRTTLLVIWAAWEVICFQGESLASCLTSSPIQDIVWVMIIYLRMCNYFQNEQLETLSLWWPAGSRQNNKIKIKCLTSVTSPPLFKILHEWKFENIYLHCNNAKDL